MAGLFDPILRLLPSRRSAARLRRAGLLGAEPNSLRGDERVGHQPFAYLNELIRERRPRKILEVGTAQSVPGVSTHHMHVFPDTTRADYTMLDIKPGPDVDVVGDLHRLPADWTGQFDAFVAGAVFEHLERPWIAAQEVARILKPDGFCFIVTHQTFPLHGYPNDFFRFSTDALALIFSDAGFQNPVVAYDHRTQIVLPPDMLARDQTENWNRDFPSYAVVRLTAAKGPAVQTSSKVE